MAPDRAASHPARRARAGRRHFPPYPGSRQRPGRARPSCRHHRGQPHRRRARRGGAGGNRPAPQIRRSTRSDPPRTPGCRPHGLGQSGARDPAAQSRRVARPRRQGRRLCAVAAAFKPHHSRLYAAWRFAALPAGHLEGRVLQPARARADEQHGPVPVRKRVRPRHLSTHRRHAKRPGALRVQRRHRRKNSSRSPRPTTPPTWSMSASSGTSRAPIS